MNSMDAIVEEDNPDVPQEEDSQEEPTEIKLNVECVEQNNLVNDEKVGISHAE